MTGVERPVIDIERCDGCGLCVEVCTQGGLVMAGERVNFRPEVECDYCGECEAICPSGAISCYYEIVWGKP